MTTTLTEHLAVTAPSVTAEQVDLITNTVAQGATPDELKLFLFDCARQGVHPLDRMIHFTKRNGKYTPITSIDFMRVRAAETGEYAGSDDAAFTEASSRPSAAQVTVWRLVQGTRCSFSATARWAEYCPGQGQDFMWQRMPHTMLAKCAEALALRKGFPRQLAGLYAKEELDQAGPTNGHSEAQAQDSTAPAPTPPAILPTRGKRENQAAATGETRGTPLHRGTVAASPAPADGSPQLGLLITNIDSTSIPSSGKPKWYIYTDDGNKSSTIDSRLAMQAQQCEASGLRVQLELENTKWGYNLKRIFQIQAPTGPPPLPEIQLRGDLQEHTEPLNEEDIPFAWLLALVVPALGMLT